MIKLNYLLLIGLILSIISSCKQENTTLTTEDDNRSYYNEPFRPQFHFSPEANWMNDPNGMVYYEGEYHLFYQYYPDSTVWGPMHWGHAVSEDMVHWEHLPIALYPDSLGLIFSGSAVIDWNNTSGFGSENNPPMIAIFTHHNQRLLDDGSDLFQYQSIAYSLDKGRSWTKYEGNPVVPNPGIRDFRDPKVIWDEERLQWVMTFAAYDKVRFYTSADLKEWEFSGTFGIDGDDRLWECPDLFPMTVKETGEKKWVLITSIQQKAPNGGTATSYFVGDWDGKTFKGDPDDQKWLDWGTDNYALVTWADVPKEDGRVLAMGWMSNWQYAQVVPTEKWRSAMTLPRELTLHQDGNIRSLPVRELTSIEGKINQFEDMTIEDVQSGKLGEGTTFKVDLSFRMPSHKKILLKVSNKQGEYVELGFDTDHFFIDRTNSGVSDFSDVFAARHTAPVEEVLEEVHLTLYIDHSSIELFANEGRWVMTDIIFPSEPYNTISLEASGAPVQLIEGSITEINGIW